MDVVFTVMLVLLGAVAVAGGVAAATNVGGAADRMAARHRESGRPEVWGSAVTGSGGWRPQTAEGVHPAGAFFAFVGVVIVVTAVFFPSAL
jgi:hypothetical protein